MISRLLAITISCLICSTIASAQICTSRISNNKTVLTSQRLNKGYSKKQEFFEIECKNSFDTLKVVYLRFKYPILDHIRIYKKIGDSLVFQEDIGDKVPALQKSIKIRTPTFKIVIPPKALDSYRVHIQTEGSLQATHDLLEDNEFLEKIELENILLYLYYGSVLIMVGYNFLLFIQTLNLQYFLYVAYLISYTLFMASFDGILHLYLWGDKIWLSNNIVNLLIPIFLSSMLLFTAEYLGKGENKIVVKRICFSTTLILATYAIGIFFVPYRIASISGALLGLASIFLLILCGLISIRQVEARYYLIAWSCLFLGVYLIIQRNMGNIEGSTILDFSMHIGSAAEALLLSLGIGYQMKKFETNNKRYQAIDFINHDIKNPLMSLNQTLDQLLKRDTTKNLKEQLERVVRKSSRQLQVLQNQIENALDYSKNKVNFCRDISLYKALHESIMEVSDLFSHPDAYLTFDFNHRSMVKGNENDIIRVFKNIFMNACQATQAQCDIAVTTTQSRNWINITIENTGSFIPKEKIKSIFEASFSEDKPEGRGLGLAACKRIVYLHGGSINAIFKEDKACFLIKLRKASVDETPTRLPNNLNLYRYDL